MKIEDWRGKMGNENEISGNSWPVARGTCRAHGLTHRNGRNSSNFPFSRSILRFQDSTGRIQLSTARPPKSIVKRPGSSLTFHDSLARRRDSIPSLQDFSARSKDSPAKFQNSAGRTGIALPAVPGKCVMRKCSSKISGFLKFSGHNKCPSRKVTVVLCPSARFV